jgi:tripartite-type tricarboxylate transporter receptor subunit TctC
MDASVIATLEGAFRKAMQDPELQRVMDNFALIPGYMDHKTYTTFMQQSHEREGQLLARLGLTGNRK